MVNSRETDTGEEKEKTVKERKEKVKVEKIREESDYVKEIKASQKGRKICIGMSGTKKRLFRNEIRKVYIASNCPKSVEEDLKYYCSFHNIPCVKLDIPNDELGIVCRKQYFISVLSILK